MIQAQAQLPALLLCFSRSGPSYVLLHEALSLLLVMFSTQLYTTPQALSTYSAHPALDAAMAQQQVAAQV